ncbi:MAG: hypothetical protein M1812_000825 [Candelaria pacifica]|nr:MAG: hypothetical protein M1812_000825 [Candelaria pacifica]
MPRIKTEGEANHVPSITLIYKENPTMRYEVPLTVAEDWKNLRDCARTLFVDTRVMKIYQTGHDTSIAPNMLLHYVKDNVKLDVSFADDVEVTFHVEIQPGPDVTTTMQVTKETTLSEIREMAWRLTRRHTAPNLLEVFFESRNVEDRWDINTEDFAFIFDATVGYYLSGQANESELDIWIKR